MGKLRRKKFYFKEGPQGKYIFSYFVIVALCIGFFTLLFIYFSANTLSITHDNYSIKLGSTPEILMDKLLSINGILILFFGTFIFIYATRFTHKIIGPLVKIEKALMKMNKGDINQEISLRKYDDCKPIVEQLNIFNFKLYSSLKMLESATHALNESLKNPIVPEGTRAYVPVEQLKPICSELEKILSCFTVSDDQFKKTSDDE